jgi:hypothetical protein
MRSRPNRIVRAALIASALSLGLTLAGCGTFDPTDLFDFDFLNSKKKLPGERKPVFPEGTPGVPQGVPPELVKGYQPPEQPAPEQQAVVPPEPEKPKAKPKPKPKVVAKPAPQPSSTAATARPSTAASAQAGSTQWPEPPPMQAEPQPQAQPRAQQGGGGWPGSNSQSGGVQWPDPPPVR